MGILSKWIQLMATNGKRPAISTDPVWRELVRFYMPRLCLYIKAFRTAFKAITETTECDYLRFRHQLDSLNDLCSESDRELQPDTNMSKVSEAVSLAYEFRSDPEFENFVCERLSVVGPRRLWMSMCYLGRLRAAYETFKEAAMHFPSFKHLQLVPVESPPSESVQYDLSFITRMTKNLGLADRDFRIKAQTLKQLCELETCTHAEMQLLLEIKKQAEPSPDRSEFPYIGTSKKTCFLCAEMLSHIGGFETRGSHSKVYPRWHIPEVSLLEPRFVLRLEGALLSIQRSIEERLQLNKTSIQHVAESSVGITTLSSGSITHQRLRHHARTRQRIENAKTDLTASNSPLARLMKDPIFHIEAIRIPVNGQAPCIIKLGICEIMNHYPDTMDRHMGRVPQFQEYWNQCQFERGILTFNSEQQMRDTLNGTYRVYWNLNPELGENRYLKGITVGSGSPLPPSRRFFYGDVFIIGIGKNESGDDFDDKGRTLYRNLHSDFLDSHLIGTTFRSMWERHELEDQVEWDGQCRQSGEEFERSRALFLASL